VLASADVYPGLGLAGVVSETYLAGGSGAATVESRDTLNTRLLAWIRIPEIRAHADKSIYLVEFNMFASYLGGRVYELEPADLPDFYKDVMANNPIRMKMFLWR
jgi:hypothetical protein